MIGAQASNDQLEKILSYLDIGKQEGAEVLTGGKRAGLPRHQTLRAAIEWSHDLCTPTEQVVWARLSVFAGTFDLAAAVAVCAPTQNADSLTFDTKAAISSRSATDQADGPRIASWVNSFARAP